jgi:hypothetical protein
VQLFCCRSQKTTVESAVVDVSPVVINRDVPHAGWLCNTVQNFRTTKSHVSRHHRKLRHHKVNAQNTQPTLNCIEGMVRSGGSQYAAASNRGRPADVLRVSDCYSSPVVYPGHTEAHVKPSKGSDPKGSGQFGSPREANCRVWTRQPFAPHADPSPARPLNHGCMS